MSQNASEVAILQKKSAPLMLHVTGSRTPPGTEILICQNCDYLLQKKYPSMSWHLQYSNGWDPIFYPQITPSKAKTLVKIMTSISKATLPWQPDVQAKQHKCILDQI
eukprot:12309019-Karenia_brevis.AAC.1